jgi:hypothetical protein
MHVNDHRHAYPHHALWTMINDWATSCHWGQHPRRQQQSRPWQAIGFSLAIPVDRSCSRHCYLRSRTSEQRFHSTACNQQKWWTMILLRYLLVKCTFQCSRFPAPRPRWCWLDGDWDLIQWHVNFRLRLCKWLIGCFPRLIFHCKMLTTRRPSSTVVHMTLKSTSNWYIENPLHYSDDKNWRSWAWPMNRILKL